MIRIGGDGDDTALRIPAGQHITGQRILDTLTDEPPQWPGFLRKTPPEAGGVRPPEIVAEERYSSSVPITRSSRSPSSSPGRVIRWTRS